MEIETECFVRQIGATLLGAEDVVEEGPMIRGIYDPTTVAYHVPRDAYSFTKACKSSFACAKTLLCTLAMQEHGSSPRP